MFPTHKYIKPGIYDVRLTVQIYGNTQSFLYSACVEVISEVTSFQNVELIDSNKEIVIHGVNTHKQTNSTTVIAKDEIVIYPETNFEEGKEIILKVK